MNLGKPLDPVNADRKLRLVIQFFIIMAREAWETMTHIRTVINFGCLAYLFTAGLRRLKFKRPA